jgi:hypothetical protein
MQFIRSVSISAALYIRDEYHFRVRAPSRCIFCKTEKGFCALGYYTRNITVDRRVTEIHIRRFRCKDCGRTASILPSFAQPYRLVQNVLIHEYFETGSAAPNSPWKIILRNYWNRFLRWLPELRRALNTQPDRAPPFNTGAEAWRALRDAVGILESITEFHVSEFQITPFGRYRCHAVPGLEQQCLHTP